MTGGVTRPPALRRTGASPSLSPRVSAGSTRWSRQVMRITCAVGRPSGTGVKVRANCSLCSSSGVILLVIVAGGRGQSGAGGRGGGGGGEGCAIGGGWAGGSARREG